MKVWFKRVTIGLVVAFLVALVGIAIFLLTFDPNAYKNKLQEIVYARYQRTLTIDGNIELSLFPRIGLSVQKVSLSDRGNSDLFASMDSARLAVAIWPLMFNRLVVDHVAVSGLQAWVVRAPDGEYNFSDLLSQRRAVSLPAPDMASPLLALAGAVSIMQTAAAAASETPDSPAATSSSTARTEWGAADLQIDIAGLTLRNGQIHLHDKKNGYVGHISGLELNTGRITADQPFDVQFRGLLLGDFPAAEARFEGQSLVKFNTDQRVYSAQRVNVQVNGMLGDLQAKAMALRGNLAYSAYSQMFSAGGLEFSVQGEVTGRDPIKNLEATLSVPQLKLDRSQAELHVERLALRTKGVRAEESFDFGLDAPNLAISPESARGEPLTATVQMQGKEERLAMVLGMSGLAGNASQLTFKELKLDGRRQLGDQLVHINMTSPASWNVFEERGSLSALRGDVRIEHPALPGGTFEFPFIGSISADLRENLVRSQLDAVLSGSKLAFQLGVKRFERPQIEFSLKADQLDFNTLFPAAAQAASSAAPSNQTVDQTPEAESGSEKAPAEAPPANAPAARTMSLGFLRDMDLTGTIEMGQLKVQNVEAAGFHADLRAVDGKLEIRDIRAELYDGKLSGQVLATSDNQFSTEFSVNGVQLEPLMAAITGGNRIVGTGTLKAKLDSNGVTLPALVAGLNGNARVQVQNGAFRGVDAAHTLRQVQDLIRSVARGDAVSSPLSFETGVETAFSQLEVDLQFMSGQGTVRKLNLVSPAVRVTQGKPASLDLVNQQLDVMVNLRVSGSANDTRDLVELRGVTVPIRITGSFSDPSYQVQWKDIAGAAVREAVKGGLLQLLGNQLESVVPGVPAADVPPAEGPGPEPAAEKDPVRTIGDALKGLLRQ